MRTYGIGNDHGLNRAISSDEDEKGPTHAELRKPHHWFHRPSEKDKEAGTAPPEEVLEPNAVVDKEQILMSPSLVEFPNIVIHSEEQVLDVLEQDANDSTKSLDTLDGIQKREQSTNEQLAAELEGALRLQDPIKRSHSVNIPSWCGMDSQSKCPKELKLPDGWRGGTLAKERVFQFLRSPGLVLVVKRIRSPDVTTEAKARIRQVIDDYGCNVVVESEFMDELLVDGFGIEGVSTWESEADLAVLAYQIELCIVLGGDGTVLWAARLLGGNCPPFLCVAHGSLGYFTMVNPTATKCTIDSLMRGDTFSLETRQRLGVSIQNDGETLISHLALNEVVVKAAVPGVVCTIECYLNGLYFTTLVADGLIIGTPSGSTAYSMSAGGSMVHPASEVVLFTPISPHTLSMRPLILPNQAVLSLKLTDESRVHGIIVSDGRPIMTFTPSARIHFRISPQDAVQFAVPLDRKLLYNQGVKKGGDRWIETICDTLSWNYRVNKKKTR